ncbi:hypothetical protein [Hymenobacter terrestris]|uniref:Outer membrane protein assembly factor BamE n=1 Tax=Hymenobacter terrestris TaxID=2748310 RepID=A0ABX2Q129_9BACT|nr:hypothetical protein [Hymenobacter terrestris]NVO84650.1 hypothetical protein [Hymenobacter terrestris]
MQLLGFGFFHHPHRDFTAAEWARSPQKRHEMVNGLQDSQQLIGLNQHQVSALLGQPNQQREETWLYYLGMKPGIHPVDADYLRLEFSDGKVARLGYNQN